MSRTTAWKKCFDEGGAQAALECGSLRCKPGTIGRQPPRLLTLKFRPDRCYPWLGCQKQCPEHVGAADTGAGHATEGVHKVVQDLRGLRGQHKLPLHRSKTLRVELGRFRGSLFARLYLCECP